MPKIIVCSSQEEMGECNSGYLSVVVNTTHFSCQDIILSQINFGYEDLGSTIKSFQLLMALKRLLD